MKRRRGAILIVAMILIFAIAALVLVLGQAMRVEMMIAANATSAREAALIQRGAEQYVLALLDQSVDPVEELEDRYYEAVPLGKGYFWILRPDYGEAALRPFGLVDETEKLNINYAPYESLIALPGMPQDIAASIVDWRDEDDTPTEGIGAESQVYLSRSPGHNAKNAAFDSVEELRLVEGFTHELLWGDGTAPPLGQTSAPETDQPFENETYRVRGFHDLLTVWGRGATTSVEGDPLIDVNGTGLEPPQREEIRQQLREIFTDHFGQQRGSELGSRLPQQSVADILDWALRMQMTWEELAQLEDWVTVGPAEANVFKINLNHAPRDVLLAIPTLSETQVDSLLSRRESEVANDPYSVAWAMDVLGQSAIGLGRFVTGRGSVYSADILASSGDGRAFRRVRIVVDASAADGPQIVYRRDLTDLGWPMDPAILDSLRGGAGIGMFGEAGR